MLNSGTLKIIPYNVTLIHYADFIPNFTCNLTLMIISLKWTRNEVHDKKRTFTFREIVLTESKEKKDKKLMTKTYVMYLMHCYLVLCSNKVRNIETDTETGKITNSRKLDNS